MTYAVPIAYSGTIAYDTEITSISPTFLNSLEYNGMLELQLTGGDTKGGDTTLVEWPVMLEVFEGGALVDSFPFPGTAGVARIAFPVGVSGAPWSIRIKRYSQRTIDVGDVNIKLSGTFTPQKSGVFSMVYSGLNFESSTYNGTTGRNEIGLFFRKLSGNLKFYAIEGAATGTFALSIVAFWPPSQTETGDFGTRIIGVHGSTGNSAAVFGNSGSIPLDFAYASIGWDAAPTGSPVLNLIIGERE